MLEIISDVDEIYSVLTLLGDSLFNQDYNNPVKLKELANKYAQFSIFLKADIDNEIKGFCSFYCNDTINKTAFLSIIVVSKTSQGNGIGHSLIEKMKTICKEKGMKNIKLEVNKNNHAAIDFYKKHGFSLISESDETGYYICNI